MKNKKVKTAVFGTEKCTKTRICVMVIGGGIEK